MKKESPKMGKKNAAGPAGSRHNNHPPQKPSEDYRDKSKEGDIRKVKEKEVVDTKNYNEAGEPVNTSPKEENNMGKQRKGPAY